jgi:hypothetical protein
MNRFARVAVTGAFAVLASAAGEATSQAQQGQTQQGQSGPSGQTTGQQGAYHGGIGQTPWFNSPEIRQQFKLTDQQYNQLNKSYGDSYGKYQQGIKSFGKDMTEQQRSLKMGELRQGFNKNFSTATNDVFTDAQQRQRYNQLYLQYQGYDAFYDPMVQEKLNLTAEQRRQLGQYGQEWHTQMNDFGRTYQTDRDGTTLKYNGMRKQYGERIRTVLTPEQQKSWQGLTGESYNFQPNVYFQTTAGAGTTNDRKRESPK